MHGGCDDIRVMRRTFSIAVVVLVLTHALMAATPMLHGNSPVKKAQGHGAHDCCPKPVVQVRECCPKTIGCPHQGHGAGACCCAESNTPGLLTRRTVIHVDASIGTPMDMNHDAAIAGISSSPPVDIPPDNSPPVLVLRN